MRWMLKVQAATLLILALRPLVVDVHARVMRVQNGAGHFLPQGLPRI